MRRAALVILLLIGCVAWSAAQETGQEKKEPDIAWKWANFAILAVVVGYLISKNLPPFFRSRTETIQKGISEAQQMKRDAEKRAAEMDARMSALGAEIETFRAQAHREMDQEGERIRQETARQIERLQQQAGLEIESAGKTARRELKTYAAKLALDLAEQRVRARLDSSAETALVDGFVQDLQQQGSQN
jgi:F-type H+-transporting ATPase subunit b